MHFCKNHPITEPKDDTDDSYDLHLTTAKMNLMLLPASDQWWQPELVSVLIFGAKLKILSINLQGCYIIQEGPGCLMSNIKFISVSMKWK